MPELVSTHAVWESLLTAMKHCGQNTLGLAGDEIGCAGQGYGVARHLIRVRIDEEQGAVPELIAGSDQERLSIGRERDGLGGTRESVNDMGAGREGAVDGLDRAGSDQIKFGPIRLGNHTGEARRDRW